MPARACKHDGVCRAAVLQQCYNAAATAVSVMPYLVPGVRLRARSQRVCVWCLTYDCSFSSSSPRFFCFCARIIIWLMRHIQIIHEF